MSASLPLEHAASWYAASANAVPERPPLAGDVSCDVCVVGAGFTGISAALHLAEQGLKVMVLEAARVGYGASGRNGGQIVNSY
ncbi:FAD-binding oxidoreductase, partial [Cobetia sp.]